MARALDSPPSDLPTRRAAIVVFSLWVAFTAAALLSAFNLFGFAPAPQASQNAHLDVPGTLANVALPSAGAFAMLIAMRRARGGMRIADGFYPLVLLNPVLFARASGPYDGTLVATGLLALMAGTIIAARQSGVRSYLFATLLAALLTLVSDTFILLLPALAAWLLFTGYTHSNSAHKHVRRRGFIIMTAAEIALLIFGLACILIDPTATPHPATLFTTIVSFIEFPLLVLAIVMLALGWRRGPGGKAPPYFPGMLALLVGMLGMLLNNFQTGQLRAPGADQTVFTLCLVYTVFALHGPRRLHWLVPPLLLIAAAAYTFFR